MYSVFLVDDEPIVLEGIRTKIDWDNSGFSFAGEATDGEIALSMIHELKPDILITDINILSSFSDSLCYIINCILQILIFFYIACYLIAAMYNCGMVGSSKIFPNLLVCKPGE